jgi:hypothetical protein
MVDRTQDISKATGEDRRVGDYLLPIAFLSIAGTAMIAWIAALVWASWWLVTWIMW